jgi:hypothetical protein
LASSRLTAYFSNANIFIAILFCFPYTLSASPKFLLRRIIMLQAVLVGIALLLTVETIFAADQPVNGYYRKDGAYVELYHRTTPDNNLYDNYSSQGNVNPWTGRRESEQSEFSNPPAYNQSSPLYTPPEPVPLYDPNPYAPRRR